MKRIISAMLTIVLGILLMQTAYASPQSGISIFVDGQRVQLEDNPVIVGGRVMLPMRPLFEMFGLDVHWDAEHSRVYTYVGAIGLRIQIGNENVYTRSFTNPDTWGGSGTLDSPPTIINGRTYVPLRFVAYWLYYNVTWNEQTRSVQIDRRFFFRDGTWYRAWFGSNNEVWRESIDMNSQGIWRFGDLSFATSGIPDGPSILYVLDSSNGTARWVDMSRTTWLNMHVHDGHLYLPGSGFPWWLPSHVRRISLDNPFYQTRIGNSDFSYGMYINAFDTGSSIGFTSAGSSFQVREDGIVVVGFDASNVIESGIFGAERMANFEQLRESYGYYLLPFGGGDPVLIESIELVLS